MCPDGGDDKIEWLRPEDRMAYFRGVLYGFRVGRKLGFSEGVRAMHGAIVEVLREHDDDYA